MKTVSILLLVLACSFALFSTAGAQATQEEVVVAQESIKVEEPAGEATEEVVEEAIEEPSDEPAEGPAIEVADKVTEEAAAPRRLIKDMTASELAESITDSINGNPRVLNFLPSLKGQTDGAGATFYLYNGKRLDSLDREELMGILRRVKSELTRINIERINRQIAVAQQGQQLSGAAQGPKVAAGAPVTQRIPQPPSVSGSVPKQVRPPAGPLPLPDKPTFQKSLQFLGSRLRRRPPEDNRTEDI